MLISSLHAFNTKQKAKSVEFKISCTVERMLDNLVTALVFHLISFHGWLTTICCTDRIKPPDINLHNPSF